MTVIYVDDETAEILELIAGEKGKTVAEIVAEMLTE